MRRLAASLIPTVIAAMTLTPTRADETPEPIRYTLRFPAPHTHYVEVEADVPAGSRSQVELMMAVWTPGSYLVREYARNVEGLAASAPDGSALTVRKSRKNRWEVQLGDDGPERFTVRYRVYCREMSVQGNWVDASFALINGAPTFLTLADDPAPRPHEVALELPPGWLTTVSGMPEAAEGGPHRYVAEDFDTLVDSPIYAGNPAIHEFEVDGKPHYLVNEGEAGVWDGPRSARDVEAIVRAQRDFWGSLPYDKYVFINLLTENGGGLEHRNSTLLMSSRWATRTRPGYLAWLNLVSHEFFHTWNVKRLRPVELGPFDYEQEVNTRSLWIAEGITSYYDRLLVRRAGLCTDEEYLAGDPPSVGSTSRKPRNDIERLHEVHGRLVQSLEDSSHDAWIKFYRRDENTPNTGISYYTKGAVAGFLLDAAIRRATDGAKSLDDAMRRAYELYSGDRGFTPEEFRATVEEVAGTQLGTWFAHTLESTEELDYDEALDWFGLRFARPKAPSGDAEPDGENGDLTAGKAWLGLNTSREDGRLVVSGVKRGTPGYEAGFNVGDEILAIDEFRVRPDALARRLEFHRPNETVTVLIARRDRLMTLDVTLGQEPVESWRLEVDPKAGEDRVAQRRSWLVGVESGLGEPGS